MYPKSCSSPFSHHCSVQYHAVGGNLISIFKFIAARFAIPSAEYAIRLLKLTELPEKPCVSKRKAHYSCLSVYSAFLDAGLKRSEFSNSNPSIPLPGIKHSVWNSQLLPAASCGKLCSHPNKKCTDSTRFPTA